MGTAILVFVLSMVAGFGLGSFLPWLGILTSLSIIGAFIIYYLDKISKK